MSQSTAQAKGGIRHGTQTVEDRALGGRHGPVRRERAGARGVLPRERHRHPGVQALAQGLGLALSQEVGELELVPLREDPPGEAAVASVPDGWRDSGVRVEAGGLRIALGVGLDPAPLALAIRVAGGGTCRVSPEPCRSTAARHR